MTPQPEVPTPETDVIALRLTGKTGLFCDSDSLAQYNDLVYCSRSLERRLSALTAENARLRETAREATESRVYPRTPRRREGTEMNKLCSICKRWIGVNGYFNHMKMHSRVKAKEPNAAGPESANGEARSDSPVPAAPTAAKALADTFPEINLSNYTHEDVERLNDWGIQAYDALRRGAK